MEGEVDLRAPHRNIVRPVQSNSSDVLSTSSNPDLIRDLQAVFKRHRPLGMMQSDKLKPKRSVVLQKEALRSSVLKSGTAVDTTKNANVALSSLDHTEKDLIVGSNNLASLTRVSQEHASITLPFTSGPDTKMNDESFNSLDVQRDQREPHAGNRDDNVVQLPSIEAHQASALDSVKKVQFSLGNHASLRGADDRMANEMGNLSSYMRSVALTEIEVDSRNQVEVSDISCDQKKQHLSNAESDLNLRSEDGIPSLLAKKTTTIQEDQLHHLGDFLSKPLTQSSVVGSSCTTTLVNSTSAPVFNSMTYGSTRLNQDCSSHMAFGNSQPIRREDMAKASYPASTYCSVVSAAQRNAAKTSASNINNSAEAKEYFPAKEPQGCVQKGGDILEEPLLDVKLNKGKELAGSGTNFQSEASSLRSINTDAKVEPSVSAKQSKVANDKGTNHSRKRNYDPDLFFKVNGKLYQRLGKIGSGGSSEVHKVISSDCTIYALKKIKLKGRDYATAYGFCQEIVYLNKLRGKNNIIQLIDSEVTDKTLLQEVMNGSMSNKDNRVKDDGYIYMVLEYGEIDLAHMLSQKWKEMDFSNQTIDENWLRFYWQQILQAVNTIHEERIVHSDLKPANFLLVKGSLKLIDFGIAKAIMSDTTNIQRDSQVGTLSYMSPEAFMCNENDVNGNTIKCGRSSDIWSLGCILYQMVYGRTPFSEYKTFWAKLKVITDPNHEITFEPVPNPCLLDLMKNCLAWDRNKRWRIPELLQHPFLVPPVPHPISSSRSFQSLELLKLIAGACDGNSEAFSLCCELEQILNNPASVVVSSSVTSRDQQCKLLARMYEVCFRLQQNLANRSV